MPTHSGDILKKISAALSEPPFKIDGGKTYLMFDSLIFGADKVLFMYQGKEVFSITTDEPSPVAVFGCIPFTLG